jgi:magnesium transporter
MKEIILPETSKKSFTWIDITNPDEKELLQVAEEYKLHRHTVRDCLEPGHLPKIETIDKVTFIITRLYLPKPGKHSTIQDITNKIAVFYSNDFIITIHRTEWLFLTEMKQTFSGMADIATPLELVTQLLWQVIHTYEKPSDDLMEQTDSYETRIFIKELIPGLHQGLYYLKRKAETCRRMLILTADVITIAHLSEKNNPFHQDLRDLHTKMITKYDQVLSNVNQLLNIYISLSTQKTNETMKVMAIFSAFFMPLTFLVGIYGMNFQHMPELTQKWGYAIIWIVMVSISVIVYLWFRRKKWL